MNNRSLRIGCVADDFTGASDAASFLRKRGLSTVLYTGVPLDRAAPVPCDAVVVALKTRSVESETAKAESLDAMDWLLEAGAEQLYLKYCSTFDSTPRGNIGPVMDAALERLGLRYSLLCPALPVNGRTVVGGRLYVNGVPLAESGMRNHPLNPMWASDIAELMAEQSRFPCFNVSLEELEGGWERFTGRLAALCAAHEHFYLVPDYYEDGHAELIYSRFGESKLLSGGSGLLGNGLLKGEAGAGQAGDTQPAGSTLLLSGSCSEATLAQLERYRAQGGRMIRVDPLKAIDGEQTAESIWRDAERYPEVMIFSSADKTTVSAMPEAVRSLAPGVLEALMGELAARAVAAGFTQIIVAGGETSGAVTKALGYGSYIIGDSIAPGVPVMMPVDNKKLRLVLKSGNFGQENFFNIAVETTSAGKRGV